MKVILLFLYLYYLWS